MLIEKLRGRRLLTTGIIWIPYGWAADDPVGMRHAIARAVLCYAAYIFAPPALTGSAISVAVLVCYGYSLLRMRRPDLSGMTAPGKRIVSRV